MGRLYRSFIAPREEDTLIRSITRLGLAAALLGLAARPLRAQNPVPAPAETTLGLRSLGLKRDTIRMTSPAAYLPGGVAALPAPSDVGARWQAVLDGFLADRQAARWRSALLGAPPEAPPPVVAAYPAIEGGGEAVPPGMLSQYAELGLLVNANIEMRFDQVRNLRCTAADVANLDSSCRGGFNPPRIDPQFAVRSGGVVGQRVHLNMDYDTQREFEASNNIQVYYQGLEDEIIRRVQVGNVTFAAPNSRFITGGIPSNNFGAQVEGQLGAVNFGAIFAQQKGNVVRGRTFTIGDRTVQPVDRDVADRDFEPLRFFFVVDPATLPGYPAVDILGLAGAALPAADRVVQVRVYRRRTTTAGTGSQNIGGIQAVANRCDRTGACDSPQRAGPFAWELLQERRDYYLDASGTWFAMASRLNEDDYLAVSYITAGGDTVGTFPAAAHLDEIDTLRLIHEPRRGPDVPTFRYEMRNAYRIGSSTDVVRESMQMAILVAQAERPDSAHPTFLNLLGLAQLTNTSVFDQLNRMFPRPQDPAQAAPLTDYYVVFPNLRPFDDSTHLPPQFLNDSLYRTPTYLMRTQGPTPLFDLRLHYNAAGSGDRRVLSLGAVQMREGSEQIMANGRALVRGRDYTMNYEIGQVTFLNPDSLFPTATTVQVQYEENPAFAAAPTSIYGLQAQYDLGDHGTIGTVGLLQQQRTTYTRPPLGFEPQSNMIGGVTANLRFEPMGITRVLDRMPGIHTSARSTLTLNAEIATSRPSPNQVGVAYIETFEEEGGTFLPLNESAWQYGSRPASTAGLGGTGIAATGFSDGDAASLVWQNLFATSTGVGQFHTSDIDTTIHLVGVGTQYETVLWMTLHPDTIGGLYGADSTGLLAPRWYQPHTPGPRWRSITTPLSSTGTDLSRIEYLEFWVYEDSARTARQAGVTFAFDFGTVYEDAVAFQPTGFRVVGRDTVYSGRRRAGEGRLDTERDTLTGSWNAGLNDVGILGDVADTIRNLDADTLVHNMPLCESPEGRQLVVFPIGVDVVRCTRHNGRSDTEDLNNDQHLDTLISSESEEYFRYVFHMNDDRYFVRTGGQTTGGGTWRLYRIPFRADTTTVGSPDIRQIRALRMTMIAPDNGTPEQDLYVGIARMKLVGAPWIKRSSTPIAGLSGAFGQVHGEVVASIVSTENSQDLGYTPPPGVTDAANTTTAFASVGSQQINERSLRLIGNGVQVGERAEAFYRFPDGDRNFLGYRQLRVWAKGRTGQVAWDDHQLEFFVKVGQDENNFYFYRQFLSTAGWTPEIVVDFSRWLALRAQIEGSFLRGEKPAGAAACGGDSLAYVRCDGPYLVQVRNPGVAPPNLAHVQELAVGLLRDSGSATDSAEVWVDDIRLSGVVNDPGYAGAISAHLSAADIADFDIAMTRRDRNFRQLGDSPSYQTDNQLAFSATVRLERLGLERLGISAPLSITRASSSTDPYYLANTDVQVAGLSGLRTPLNDQTSYGLVLRRTRRGTLWWQRALVDNLVLSGSWNGARSATSLSTGKAHATDIRLDYALAPGARSFGYLPDFLKGLLDALPGFLRNTEAVRGLRNGRLRWTPVAVTAGAEVANATSENTSFTSPIATPGDSLATAMRLHSSVLRQRVGVELLPFAAASFGLQFVSERDLRDYGDSTTQGRLAQAERRNFLGTNVGFERARSLSTRFAYTPNLVTWLRPRFTMSGTYNLQRDANQSVPERSVGDSTGAYRIPSTFQASRSTDLGGAMDLSNALRGGVGDSSGLRKLLTRLSPIDFNQHTEHRAQFSHPGFDPGLSFQLGFAGADAYRAQNGVHAAASTDVNERRVSGAVRLPAGLALNAAFVSTTTTQILARSDRQQQFQTTDRDWPNVTARWLWTPRGFFAHAITSVSASYGTRRRLSSSVMPSLGIGGVANAVTTSSESRSAPLTVQVLWANHLSTGYTVGDDHAIATQAGNMTRNDRSQQSMDASFALKVPYELIPLKNVVRTTMRYTSSDQGICIVQPGIPGCLSIADSRRSEYSLVMDTDMPPNVSAGLSASWVLTEDRHADRKFTQFTLTATVRVVFQAGEVR